MDEKPMKRGVLLPAGEDRALIRPLKAAGTLSDTYKKGLGGGAAAGMPLTRKGPTVRMMIQEAAAKAAATGTDPEEIIFSIVWPEDRPESELKQLVQEIGGICAEGGLKALPGQIICAPLHSDTGAAEEDPGNNSCVVTVCAMGRKMFPEGEGGPGEDSRGANRLGKCRDGLIAVSGPAGLAGTGILIKRWEKELLERFPRHMIDETLQLSRRVWTHQVIKKIIECTGKRVWPVGQGGIFAALWYFCNDLKCGMDAQLPAIPILQETVEICEYLDIHPYLLYGQGSVLFTLPQEDEASVGAALAAENIPFRVIGQMTQKEERIIRSGDEIRYLDKPQQDYMNRAVSTPPQRGRL